MGIITIKRPENPAEYPIPGEPWGELQARLMLKAELARAEQARIARETQDRKNQVVQDGAANVATKED